LSNSNKVLVIFLDSGHTLVNENTEVRVNDIVQSAEMIEGGRELLYELKKRGYQICLMADGMIEAFDNVFNQHGVRHLFDGYITSEEVGQVKPSLKMFEAGLQVMGLTDDDKKRIVMVGNNLGRDILGANKFGITSVFTNWSDDYPKMPSCAEEEPDYTYGKPLELLHVLEQIERDKGILL